MCEWKVKEGSRQCPNCEWSNPVLQGYDNREVIIVGKNATWECDNCMSPNLESDEHGNMIQTCEICGSDRPELEKAKLKRIQTNHRAAVPPDFTFLPQTNS